MLLLTATPGRDEDTVHIITPHGERITVHVCSINGNQVRLGFDAPRTIEIARQKLLTREAPQ